MLPQYEKKISRSPEEREAEFWRGN